MNNIDEMYNPDFFLEKQPDEVSLIKLKAGNILSINHVHDEIKFISRNKVLQLIVRIQDDGLRVDINASQLNINTSDELNLTSKKITLEATEQLNIKTGGNLVTEVEKDFLTEVKGTNKSIAQVQKLTANLGNVEIKANDDVRLDGESVKLNCT
jgi:hypothetical protein